MRIRTLAAACGLALVSTVAIAAPAWAHPVLHIAASPTTVQAGNTVAITITGTSNGNYTGARIDVSAASGTGGTTGTLPSFTTISSCASTPSGVTCSEVGTVDRLALPALTNGQAFTFTLTLTVDATTAAGTFTSIAQFYKSDNTTDGPTTGPVITVTAANSELVTTKNGYGTNGAGQLTLQYNVVNTGPVAATSITYSATATPAGFATETHSNCGDLPGQSFSCDLGFSIPAGFGFGGNAHFDIATLALGTYTVTITISPANDVTPADNTISYSCTVITALLVTCT